MTQLTIKNAALMCLFWISASTSTAQTPAAPLAIAEPASTAPQILPRVDKKLVVKTIAIGQIYERQRPLFLEYLKEIEQNEDFKNWKVPPHKAYNQ